MSLETALDNAAAAMNRLAAALESTRTPLPAVVPVVKTAVNPAPIEQETAEEKPAEEKPAEVPAEKQKPAAPAKESKKAEKPAKTATPAASRKKSEVAPVEDKKAESTPPTDNENAGRGVKAELSENFETKTVTEFMDYVKETVIAANLGRAKSVALLKNVLDAAGHDSFHTLPVEARGDVLAALKAELGDKMPW